MNRSSARQRVYETLKTRRWTPGFELTRPEVGGSEGLRRLRELRADGWDIRVRRIPESTAHEYRLVGRVA